MGNFYENALKEKVEAIKKKDNVYDAGRVIKVSSFIIEASGLEDVGFFEAIEIVGKGFGYITNIKKDRCVIALVKQTEAVIIGDQVRATGKEFAAKIPKNPFGSIIDIFAEDKLSGQTFADLQDIPIERKTVPLMDRTSVNRQLHTGISGIDMLYPIGKGQRQLILGDKKTGKTQICLDAIVNQRGKDVLCFYVAIGKTKKEVKDIYMELFKRGAMEYTSILVATNDEKPPVLSVTPYVALSVAEDIMLEGKDVLVVIDDLKRHADAYREISLMAGKTPGRDAYPADIFYTHSRLLEKGCQHKCGGSITVLPVGETKGGDLTDYISTNIISITDGQIMLSKENFDRGEKPAISYGLSVSRLGGAVQSDDLKKKGTGTRMELLSYLETRKVYELANIDEMGEQIRNKILRGKVLVEKLKQYKYSPYSEGEMLELFREN